MVKSLGLSVEEVLWGPTQELSEAEQRGRR